MRRFSLPLIGALPLVAGAPLDRVRPRQEVNDGGCQQRSQSMAWDITDFDFHASHVKTSPTATEQSSGYIKFEIYNPGVDQSATCTAQSNVVKDFFYGDVPYSCVAPDGSVIGETNFDFSRGTGTLNVNQVWTCKDLTPQSDPQPGEFVEINDVSFSASGKAEMKLVCATTKNVTMGARWRPGQVYSQQDITCDLINDKITPTNLMAIV